MEISFPISSFTRGVVYYIIELKMLFKIFSNLSQQLDHRNRNVGGRITDVHLRTFSSSQN